MDPHYKCNISFIIVCYVRVRKIIERYVQTEIVIYLFTDTGALYTHVLQYLKI
jgi:hypothetical protein